MKDAEKTFENPNWLPPKKSDDEIAADEATRNYHVNNYGMDRDIMGSLEDIKIAEGIREHKWIWNGDKYKNPSRHNDVTGFYSQGS